MKRFPQRRPEDSGEFLWLVSLSDMMMLLFIFFVVLFSFTYKQLKESDFQRIAASFRNEKAPPTPAEQVRTQLNQWVKEQKLDDQITVTQHEDVVLLEIKDKLIFASGEFDLLPMGAKTLRSLVPILEKIPKDLKIGIEGHTDDIPIHNNTVEDNWELSAKRSLAVLRTLELKPDLLKRTVAMSYGDTRPLFPNRDPQGNSLPENQAKNRRVTLRIF